jgi:hypothetical protein
MSTIPQNLAAFSLAKPAFSQRLRKLQEDLKATLQPNTGQPDAVLAAQDQLITRLEGWIDSIEDLHMLTRRDIDLFRQALATNRRVYRMKALAMHNIEMSPDERDALCKSLSATIRKIFSATVPPKKLAKKCTPEDEAHHPNHCLTKSTYH